MANPEITYPLLCLDTSTPSCSVCLFVSEEKVIFRNDGNQNSHSEILFSQVREVLIEAKVSFSEIKSVVVSAGPGSYTGLRIAASALKGWFFGSEITLFATDTLPFLAHHALKSCNNDRTKIVAILDARRKHVYTQPFELKDSLIISKGPATIQEIDFLKAHLDEQTVLVGTGIQRFGEISSLKISVDVCEAKYLHDIIVAPNWSDYAKKVELSDFEPDYLGSPV